MVLLAQTPNPSPAHLPDMLCQCAHALSCAVRLHYDGQAAECAPARPAGRTGWWIVTPFQMAICVGTTIANHIVAGQAMKVRRLETWRNTGASVTTF